MVHMAWQQVLDFVHQRGKTKPGHQQSTRSLGAGCNDVWHIFSELCKNDPIWQSVFCLVLMHGSTTCWFIFSLFESSGNQTSFCGVLLSVHVKKARSGVASFLKTGLVTMGKRIGLEQKSMEGSMANLLRKTWPLSLLRLVIILFYYTIQ